jgi:enoyl-CoA hydratase/carnithine racemase
MTTAFARVGFSGDYGGTYFMTQLVGAAKARELMAVLAAQFVGQRQRQPRAGGRPGERRTSASAS